jgi:hypothetical protein
MKIYYDKCNSWLYIGDYFILMFDNWMNWFKPSYYPVIREWNFFQIMWDNGAWWGFDLDEKEDIKVPRMNGKYIENEEFNKRTGYLSCFVQIIILGIGIRFNYKRWMAVVWKKEAMEI